MAFEQVGELSHQRGVRTVGGQLAVELGDECVETLVLKYRLDDELPGGLGSVSYAPARSSALPRRSAIRSRTRLRCEPGSSR